MFNAFALAWSFLVTFFTFIRGLVCTVGESALPADVEALGEARSTTEVVGSPVLEDFFAPNPIRLPAKIVQVHRPRAPKRVYRAQHNTSLSDGFIDISPSHHHRKVPSTVPVFVCPTLRAPPKIEQGGQSARHIRRAAGIYGYNHAFGDALRSIETPSPDDGRAADSLPTDYGAPSQPEDDCTNTESFNSTLQEADSCLQEDHSNTSSETHTFTSLDDNDFAAGQQPNSAKGFSETCEEVTSIPMASKNRQRSRPTRYMPTQNDTIIEDIEALLRGEYTHSYNDVYVSQQHAGPVVSEIDEHVDLTSENGDLPAPRSHESLESAPSPTPLKIIKERSSSPLSSLPPTSTNNNLDPKLKPSSYEASTLLDLMAEVEDLCITPSRNAWSSKGSVKTTGDLSESEFSVTPSDDEPLFSPMDSVDSPMPSTPTDLTQLDTAKLVLSEDGLGISKPTTAAYLDVAEITACPEELFDDSCYAEDDFFASLTLCDTTSDLSGDATSDDASWTTDQFLHKPKSWTKFGTLDEDDCAESPESPDFPTPAMIILDAIREALASVRDSDLYDPRASSAKDSFTSCDFYSAASEEEDDSTAAAPNSASKHNTTDLDATGFDPTNLDTFAADTLEDLMRDIESQVSTDEPYGDYGTYSFERRRSSQYSMPGSFAGDDLDFDYEAVDDDEEDCSTRPVSWIPVYPITRGWTPDDEHGVQVAYAY
ncbi:hypothetical protein HGRIS_003707 [Hohenbuehelia grisea]|uniref:Uncharacterized protein n=1 Tax=Hohenbuehelia grisea TaxID=104357 RepID=A0ABR3JGQ5_9AGAR